MLVKEFLFHSIFVSNGNVLKMRVSEICVKPIHVKQGLSVYSYSIVYVYLQLISANNRERRYNIFRLCH